MEYQDIIYEVKGRTAYITINRPEKYNAFRGITCDELIHAIKDASWNKEIGCIVLSGAGEKAFCTGGDQSTHDGQYTGKGTIGLPVEDLHSAIRDAPKPVIARVQGYAIGGGNVLALLCDLTICSENAVFGQVGPKMGSVDPGFGTALLTRVVGEKKAREIWFLCRQYKGQAAVDIGLANICVPAGQLDAEVEKWANEINEKSPTAIALAKRSMNIDTEHIRGISALGFQGVALYYNTEESKEGGRALAEKRKPDFYKYI
jgi:2-ketocyclohexanecarboxyl-CoA hydrolase